LQQLAPNTIGFCQCEALLQLVNAADNGLLKLLFRFVIFSCACRHVALRCGAPIASPALTLNRLCGSGFETVIQGAEVSKTFQSKADTTAVWCAVHMFFSALSEACSVSCWHSALLLLV
jgi:hypothetical protein